MQTIITPVAATTPMNRSDLITELTNKFLQLTKEDAELAVNTLLEAMADAQVQGRRIEIRGFGGFSVTQRAPRIGRNPRTGARVDIPATRVIHFKPGKDLRESLLKQSETRN